MFVKFLIAILLTEAVSELAVKGKIFEFVRRFLTRINPGFLGQLVDCGYCVSFWVALVVGPVFGLRVVFDNFFGVMLAVVILHRCASHLHDFTHLFARHGQ